MANLMIKIELVSIIIIIIIITMNFSSKHV